MLSSLLQSVSSIPLLPFQGIVPSSLIDSVMIHHLRTQVCSSNYSWCGWSLLNVSHSHYWPFIEIQILCIEIAFFSSNTQGHLSSPRKSNHLTLLFLQRFCYFCWISKLLLVFLFQVCLRKHRVGQDVCEIRLLLSFASWTRLIIQPWFCRLY